MRFFLKLHLERLGFPILLLVFDACKTVQTDQVFVMPARKTTRIEVLPQAFEFRDVIQRHVGSTFKALNEEKVIAWAAKRQILEFPPNVIQEAIVQAVWTDQSDRSHVALLYCTSWGGDTALRHWELSPNVYKTVFDQLESPPTGDFISKFIHMTDFGYNEPLAAVAEVSRIECYTQDEEVIQVLRAGLSKDEKMSRLGQQLDAHRR